MLLVGVGVMFYMSTLNHHFIIDTQGNLVGSCTSSSDYLELHLEAFGCEEDFDDESNYSAYRCRYKGRSYKIYDINNFDECRAAEKSFPKKEITLSTEKRLSTNFNKRKDSLWDYVKQDAEESLDYRMRSLNIDYRTKKEAPSTFVKEVQFYDKKREKINNKKKEKDTAKTRRLKMYMEKHGIERIVDEEEEVN